jgi:UDP-N-acetylmuramate--alanine ligase
VFVPQIEALPDILNQVLRDGDILLTQGAGSIGTIAPKLAELWARKEALI